MTREEAKELLLNISAYDIDTQRGMAKQEAIEMAIQALEQEPSGDLISKQAVLKIIDGWYENNLDTENIEDLIILITYMASVTPQPKTGHWIPTYGNVECSVCGSVKDSREVGRATHYCDFCGAKMVEPQESEG